MGLSISEKIKIVLKRRGMTMGQLAEQTNQTRQNLSNKMSRDNFPEKELREIADALGCELEINLIMRDSGAFFVPCCPRCYRGVVYGIKNSALPLFAFCWPAPFLNRLTISEFGTGWMSAAVA